MPTESDQVEHLRNLFVERKRALDARHREVLRQISEESKELEEWAKTLGELQGVLPRLISGLPRVSTDDAPKMLTAPTRKDGRSVIANAPSAMPWAKLIEQFMAERFKATRDRRIEFTAAEVRWWVHAQGYKTTTAMYNEIHSTLRRRVAQGYLSKEGPRFIRVRDDIDDMVEHINSELDKGNQDGK